MYYQTYALQKDLNIATLSEAVVDMVQEMEKLQVKDIKDRKLVQVVE